MFLPAGTRPIFALVYLLKCETEEHRQAERKREPSSQFQGGQLGTGHELRLRFQTVGMSSCVCRATREANEIRLKSPRKNLPHNGHAEALADAFPVEVLDLCCPPLEWMLIVRLVFSLINAMRPWSNRPI
jgi:hypothetical protein